MELKFYQECSGINKKYKLVRRLILLEEGKRAFYVNGSVVESLWLSTAEMSLSFCREITREEALVEVPELAYFLEHVVPTLAANFVFHPLTSINQKEMKQPGEAP